MENDGVCKIYDIGDMLVEANVGCNLFLKNVRHVSDMRIYLISIGALNDEGYRSHFVEGK